MAMEDGYISALALLGWTLWIAALGCLFGSWVALALLGDESMVPRFLIATAMVTSMLAVAVHIKRMTVRVLELIRATSGLEDRRPGLRSVR